MQLRLEGLYESTDNFFSSISHDTLKVLIATITRETSEILKNAKVRCEHQETFHLY